MARKTAKAEEVEVEAKTEATPIAEPAVVGVPATAEPRDWAVSSLKLNRAVAYVQVTSPGLKGAELEGAVKARYIALGGLLVDDKPVRGVGRRGRVVNVADNDED